VRLILNVATGIQVPHLPEVLHVHRCHRVLVYISQSLAQYLSQFLSSLELIPGSAVKVAERFPSHIFTIESMSF
jgi:hypothetical protein